MNIDSVIFKPANNNKNKLTAVFYDKQNKRVATRHFGQLGASDYTIHQDPERKLRYLSRHRKTENWDNPLTPGALSRWVLWESKSLDQAIRQYKKRFGLN